MDQHPIPQDVTGFQFKLIGSMTVKQFGYVAAGVIAAVILYYLPINVGWGILIKVLFIPIFGGSGFIIAFVPIEGRPVDVMAANFSKAIFSPNQYVYHKIGRKFLFSTIATTKEQPVETTTTTKKVVPQQQRLADERNHKLQALLHSSQGRARNDLDKKEMAFLHTFAAPTPVTTTGVAKPTNPATHIALKPLNMTPSTTAPVIPHVSPIAQRPVQPVAVNPTAAPTTLPDREPYTPDSLAKKEALLEQQLQTAKQQESTPTPTPAAHQKVVELEKQMQEIHQQKTHLEQEIAQLKTQLSVQTQPIMQQQPTSAVATQQTPLPQQQPAVMSAPIPQPVQPKQTAPSVRNIPQDMTKKAGLPHVSDTPNVVVGIVKDSRGNVLPNMLVEVKDKEGNPVRAFKTNPLGQFASATPLNPGTYTIELEDPKKQHSFDIIQITTNNQILLPIEITSHDAREALRQQLFN